MLNFFNAQSNNLHKFGQKYAIKLILKAYIQYVLFFKNYGK